MSQKIFGYWENWQGNPGWLQITDLSSLQYCTHALYSFCILSPLFGFNATSPPCFDWDGKNIYGPNPSGLFEKSGEEYVINSNYDVGQMGFEAMHLFQFINICKQNGVKGIVSIGGWSDTQFTPKFTVDWETKGKNLLGMILALQKYFNVDGVDFDWEHLGQYYYCPDSESGCLNCCNDMTYSAPGGGQRLHRSDSCPGGQANWSCKNLQDYYTQDDIVDRCIFLGYLMRKVKEMGLSVSYTTRSNCFVNFITQSLGKPQIEVSDCEGVAVTYGAQWDGTTDKTAWLNTVKAEYTKALSNTDSNNYRMTDIKTVPYDSINIMTYDGAVGEIAKDGTYTVDDMKKVLDLNSQVAGLNKNLFLIGYEPVWQANQKPPFGDNLDNVNTVNKYIKDNDFGGIILWAMNDPNASVSLDVTGCTATPAPGDPSKGDKCIELSKRAADTFDYNYPQTFNSDIDVYTKTDSGCVKIGSLYYLPDGILNPVVLYTTSDCTTSCDCGEYGQCKDSKCQCSYGYTGDKCDVPPDICCNGMMFAGTKDSNTKVSLVFLILSIVFAIAGIVTLFIKSISIVFTIIFFSLAGIFLTVGIVFKLIKTTSADCVDIDCGSHGKCSNGKCVCDSGWSGDKCQTPVADPCIGINCGDHGKCSNGACVCDAGWSGDKCDQTIDGRCPDFNKNRDCCYSPDNITENACFSNWGADTCKAQNYVWCPKTPKPPPPTTCDGVKCPINTKCVTGFNGPKCIKCKDCPPEKGGLDDILPSNDAGHQTWLSMFPILEQDSCAYQGAASRTFPDWGPGYKMWMTGDFSGMVAFKTAAKKFSGFCDGNDLNKNKLELAAFLGNVTQETGDPSLGTGLVSSAEQGSAQDQLLGRGALQLTGASNYYFATMGYNYNPNSGQPNPCNDSTSIVPTDKCWTDCASAPALNPPGGSGYNLCKDWNLASKNIDAGWLSAIWYWMNKPISDTSFSYLGLTGDVDDATAHNIIQENYGCEDWCAIATIAQVGCPSCCIQKTQSIDDMTYNRIGHIVSILKLLDYKTNSSFDDLYRNFVTKCSGNSSTCTLDMWRNKNGCGSTTQGLTCGNDVRTSGQNTCISTDNQNNCQCYVCNFGANYYPCNQQNLCKWK